MGGPTTWTEADRGAADNWTAGGERIYGAAYLPLLGLVPVSDIPIDPGPVAWQEQSSSAVAFSEAAAPSPTTWTKAGS